MSVTYYQRALLRAGRNAFFLELLPSNLKKLRLAKPITNEPVMQLNLPHLTHLSLICDESIEFSKCHYLTSYKFPSLERLHIYADSTKDEILTLDVFEKFLGPSEYSTPAEYYSSIRQYSENGQK